MSLFRALVVPLLALVLAFAAGASRAQTPAPSVTKPACSKPEAFPGRLASDTQRKTWQKDVMTWQDCVKAYVKDQQALADAHLKAANTAIDDYNAATKEFNDQAQGTTPTQQQRAPAKSY